MVFLENFGSTVEEVVADTPVEYLVRTAFADLLPAPKRWLVNSAVRHVKKMVPRFDLPKAIPFRDVLSKGRKSPAFLARPRTREDIAILQYTGGTTGVAKGAMLTHGNLLSNIGQTQAYMGQIKDDGSQWLIEGQEIAIAPLPLYHIYAFISSLLFLPSTGQHSVLIANPRDIGMFIRSIKPYKFTFFTGLNTLFVGMMNHPEFETLGFQSTESDTFRRHSPSGRNCTTVGEFDRMRYLGRLWADRMFPGRQR